MIIVQKMCSKYFTKLRVATIGTVYIIYNDYIDCKINVHKNNGKPKNAYYFSEYGAFTKSL